MNYSKSGKMYILICKSDRSKYFKEGLKIARRLGGSWDGENMVLKIPESDLLTSHDRLLPLFEIMGSCSSLQASFRGKQVHPYGFIVVMHYIRECASKRSCDPDHCSICPEEKGWGCKRLSIIQHHVFGDGKYAINEKFWYNFGSFNEKNEWVIDKKALYRKLYRQAEEKGLILCPFFDIKKLERALDDLPVVIVPDDRSYRVHYEVEFYRGDRLKIPVNIRHIQNPNDCFVQSQRENANSDTPSVIHRINPQLGFILKIQHDGPAWQWFSKN